MKIILLWKTHLNISDLKDNANVSSVPVFSFCSSLWLLIACGFFSSGFNGRKYLLYSSTQNTAFLSNHGFHPQNFAVPLRPGTTMGTGKNLEEFQSCREGFIIIPYCLNYKTVGPDTEWWKTPCLALLLMSSYNPNFYLGSFKVSCHLITLQPNLCLKEWSKSRRKTTLPEDLDTINQTSHLEMLFSPAHSCQCLEILQLWQPERCYQHLLIVAKMLPAKDATRHLTMTEMTFKTKNYLTPNLNSAEVEKLLQALTQW